MSQLWLYTQTGWHQVEDPFADCPNGTNFETYLKQRGYETLRLRQEYDVVNLEIWRGNNAAPYPFLVELTWQDSWVDTMACADLPALLQWLREYGQVHLWPVFREELSEIKAMLTRAFEAWHGHNPAAICPECDAQEVELQRLMKANAQKKQAATQEKRV